MKFASTMALAAICSMAQADDQEIRGGARMNLTPFSAETGPLLDTLHDTSFTIKPKNNNYLWMDTISLLMDSPTPQETLLKSKVDQYKARKQRSKKTQKFGGKKHKLGTDDQVKTTNYIDQLYYGALYVGTSDQEMQVIIDTSTDWLVIEGQDCLSCNENKYDPNTSNLFAQVEEGYSNRSYGSFIDLAV